MIFFYTFIDVDVCPHKLGDRGRIRQSDHWRRCSSNDDCPSDRVCMSPAPRLPGLWICAKKPCHSHSDCKPGLHCYKKISYGHPTIDWSIKGICCEMI